MKFNDVELNDTKSIADAFADFFRSSYIVSGNGHIREGSTEINSSFGDITLNRVSERISCSA